MFTEYEGRKGGTIAMRAPKTADFASKTVLTLIRVGRYRSAKQRRFVAQRLLAPNGRGSQ